ncbi:hypothetical protein ACJX0J_036111, partial [Zea mays]
LFQFYLIGTKRLCCYHEIDILGTSVVPVPIKWKNFAHEHSWEKAGLFPLWHMKINVHILSNHHHVLHHNLILSDIHMKR